MRAAPPVQAQLAKAGLLRALVSGLYAVAGAACAAWALAWWGLWTTSSGLPPPVLSLGVLLAAGLTGAIGHRQALALFAREPGLLAWTGMGWQWQPPPAPSLAGVQASASVAQPIHQLQVMLDLGPWLLLRWQLAAMPAVSAPTGRGRCGWGLRFAPWVWACATQAAQPGVWHSLRIALQAHGRPDGPAQRSADERR